MTRNRKSEGMALLMVLVLIAVATVVGLSYLYSATVRTAGAQNMVSAERAEYLAQSGLEHALYVVQTSDDAEDLSPWGPYTLDNSEGDYSFSIWEDDQTSGLYHISSTGTVGEISRIRNMSVLLRSYGYIDLNHVLLIGSNDCVLPSSANLTGNVHGNSNVYVLGTVNGNVSACGSAEDWGGGVNGSVVSGAPYVPVPKIDYEDYIHYVWYGADNRGDPDLSGDAIQKETGLLTSSDPLCGGGSIISGNPGGVVHLVPAGGNPVIISDNVHFQGTLVVDGDMVLDGTNIQIEAQSNYPAIVASGQVIINSDAGAEIDGMVIANGGIAGTGEGSHVTITGGLLTRTMGMSDELKGTQIIQFDSSRCFIYDFSGGTSIVDAN
ncbi:MAG: hypothetical protein ACP5HU_09930 [Phycisphaerae bacterium]